MTIKVRLMGGAAVCALALAGCAHSANISPKTIGKGSPFCNDLTVFQGQAAAVEAASTQSDLATLRAAVNTAYHGLLKLRSDADTLPDKVNGHLVKDDITIAADTYGAVNSALAAASPSDPKSVTNALASVQAKEGQAFTTSTGRLDSYSHDVCGLVVSSATTTTAGPASSTTVPGATTTVGPVGPTVPTTAPPATGAPAGGPAATTATTTPAAGPATPATTVTTVH